MKYFPALKSKGKEVNQAPYGGSYPNAPKRNPFYVLRAKEANLEKGLCKS